MEKSPVPQAMSNTVPRRPPSNSRIAFRLHDLSIPIDSKWFNKSYFGAIPLNISCTFSFFAITSNAFYPRAKVAIKFKVQETGLQNLTVPIA